MNSYEMNERMLDTIKAIRVAEAEWDKQIELAANTEKRYERRKAKAFLQVEGKSATEREAKAEIFDGFEDKLTVGDLRYEYRMAVGLRDSAKAAARVRAQELSALQSLAALTKAGLEFDRTAPETEP